MMSEQNINNELDQNEEVNQGNISQENVEETTDNKELDLIKEQIQKEKDQYLRLFAEFDNYKKRTNKERIELFKTANKEVILALLPVLDDFQRALPTIESGTDEAIYKGVELIQTKLLDTLRQKGLKPIEVNAGDDFDTDFHEAVTQIPAPTEELKGKIVDVIETGYLLSDVVIRYAKVVVGM
ncbi:nucleotide exchange factor GrpE [Vaginella massiliensis]|uniref:nucleotide exchange factor GrpE n=1 Tax=Vaginella massiliensis TaxID=1816680 RepID=UPI00375185C8